MQPIQRIPNWSEPLLQGIAFWLGYKKIYYPHYHATEGAIVFEACQLISSHLDSDKKLFCEVPYKQIKGLKQEKGKKRADLVITNAKPKKRSEIKLKNVETVIEVKRTDDYKLVEEDLKRLADFLDNSKSKQRSFLFLVSKNKRPGKFVAKEGSADRKYGEIADNKNFHYKVRRVCKSASSFKSKSRAHYACLIEVLKK